MQGLRRRSRGPALRRVPQPHLALRHHRARGDGVDPDAVFAERAAPSDLVMPSTAALADGVGHQLARTPISQAIDDRLTTVPPPARLHARAARPG